MTSKEPETSSSDDSAKRWRSIAENPFDFVVVIGPDYKYRFVNHVAPGLRLEDLIGKATPFDFVDPEQHAPMRAALEKAFAEGVATSYDVHVAPLDKWFSSVVGPIEEGDDVTEVSILTRDITEAKRAVVSLEESEHRLRMALDGAGAGLFDMDVESGDVIYTPRFYRLLGHEPGDPALVGSVTSFRERLHPDDSRIAEEALRAALEESAPFDAEYRLRTADGTYRWFHGRGTVRPFPGRGRRFVGIITDVTERKEQEAERERLEAQLWHAQKMETVGTLAGGIAHDVNNALLPVLAYAELGLLHVGAEHPAREALTGIVEAAERARDLLQQVLAYSRRTADDPRPIDVPSAVSTAVRLVRAGLPASVSLEVDLDAATPEILAEETQVHQIVANLCTNAYHALEGRPGKVRVSVVSVRLTAPTSVRSGRLEPGTYVQITVTDSGAGISAEAMDRILEPFYTSKGVGQGTGLGLSVVHGIVVKRGGAIDFDSAPGQGASFRVYLPAAPGAAAPISTPPPDAAPQSRADGGRVLLVDDDHVVAEVQKRTLRSLGYAVTVAASGEEALRLFESTPVDVVLTDQRMPGMTGLELAKALLERRPGLPVVIASGYLDAAAEIEASSLGLAGFLQKPYRVADLDAALKRALAPSS